MVREQEGSPGGRNLLEFWHRRPETALAIAIGAMAVAGLVLRLVELAERPLHHDESLDAWYSWKFLEGTYEGYDPVYHGPLRFYLTGGVFWAFGESHTTARLVSVLAGVGLIVLPWFLRRSLGPVATLTASAVLAFSPIALYMTRLGREDALIALITLAMMVVIVRFMDRPLLMFPSLLGFLLAAGFAVKETTFIVLFIFGSFFLALLAEQAFSGATGTDFSGPSGGRSRGATPPNPGTRGGSTGWSWMLPAGLVPMGVAYVVSSLFDLEIFITLGIYGILLVAAVWAPAGFRAIGGLPTVRIVRSVPFWGWMLAAAVFLVFFALWFTVFFTQMDGFWDGFTEGITYWRGEQSTNRGGEPWYYYLYTVPLYEYLVCALGVIGSVHVFRNPTFTGKFMVWTAGASWLSYSWAAERFPWLTLHLLVPMSFLAGYGIQVLWQARSWVGTRLNGLRRAGTCLAGVVLLGLLVTTLYTSYTANYVNQRDPRELLTQVHTTHEYVSTVQRIEALDEYSRSIDEGPVTVAIDVAMGVPNLWYFRDYEALTWVSANSASPPTADFVLHLPSNNVLESLPDPGLYQTTRLPLRDWWAPQFSSYHDGWFSGWANWLVDREVWNDSVLGSSDFDLSVSHRALNLESRMAATG
ncbi:flippase activity-associated protein Agl23 [Candidatus Poriferisocius sp.]|uniref:flippase activity-associated protein Agl23 n=1 Tax=Candidatus Poriferisocius sp. TaxID=3101276 RepID=UPI003B027032